MQSDYHYFLQEPEGLNFDIRFKPQLTPLQMLELGVFGGKYMTDCPEEFPKTWFAKAKLSSQKRDSKLNLFGVNASQSLSIWRKNGWIFEEDPRGWFQWYCRYYRGRRIPEIDDHQIRRWVAMRRHVTQIKNNCHPRDLNCRKRQRQAVLHWAYDSRKI